MEPALKPRGDLVVSLKQSAEKLKEELNRKDRKKQRTAAGDFVRDFDAIPACTGEIQRRATLLESIAGFRSSLFWTWKPLAESVVGVVPTCCEWQSLYEDRRTLPIREFVKLTARTFPKLAHERGFTEGDGEGREYPEYVGPQNVAELDSLIHHASGLVCHAHRWIG